MKLHKIFLIVLLQSSVALGQGVTYDLHEYKPLDGLKAEVVAGALQLTWQGEGGQQLRAVFVVQNRPPLVRELAIRSGAGGWKVLARNLSPEFDVVSGRRRISEQQMAPLRALGVALTPEVIENEKWNAFWDAPLDVPGSPRTNLDLPRRPEEIRRATASYDVDTCRVKTEGARLEVTFPGLSMGIFSGELRFTVYKGTNLLRQEAIAKTTRLKFQHTGFTGIGGFFLAKLMMGPGWKKMLVELIPAVLNDVDEDGKLRPGSTLKPKFAVR